MPLEMSEYRKRVSPSEDWKYRPDGSKTGRYTRPIANGIHAEVTVEEDGKTYRVQLRMCKGSDGARVDWFDTGHDEVVIENIHEMMDEGDAGAEAVIDRPSHLGRMY